MKITEAEREVLEALWKSGPCGLESLLRNIKPEWQPSTVKTLLARLVRKGAVNVERDGKVYRYTAEIDRQTFALQSSHGLLERFFGGRITPMVAAFFDAGRLSKRDIEELRKIVDSADESDV